MISQVENVEAHALRRQGWSISAIARHLGRDRKTVRAYLSEQREPGVRARTVPDSFTAFAPYVAQRLAEDPHVWAVVLFDEVVAAGFTGSYPTFTRQLRQRGLRPACGACTPTKGRPAAIIEHPPGAETQWDWVDLPSPPAAWGWGKTARLLLGTLPRSGRWRACLSQATVQPHPVEGLDRVTRALAGVSRDWRLDRMATVVHPASGDVTASFAAVARRYAVTVAICPPRRGNRKGAVQKAIHGAAQRWWRTLPEDLTVEQAQASIDAFCAGVIDPRMRIIDGTRKSIAEHAGDEPLRPAPLVPFPATISETRLVSAQALVAWRGNRYSLAPAGAGLVVRTDSRRQAPPRQDAHPHQRRHGRIAARDARERRRASRRRHRHGRLHGSRQRKEHPAMTPPIAPATAEQAAAYQRLRGHLAALKLSTAAEHLPAVLDAARAERLTVTVTAAAALLDRLLHRSVVINLDGASYRLREHQARNETLRATTTGTRQPLQ